MPKLKKKIEYNTNLLEAFLRTYGVKLQREYRFCPGRQFRADLAIPEWRLLCEIDGGVWTQGRHTRGSGFVKDMEKFNLAAIHGYYVIKYTPQQFGKCQGIDVIEKFYQNNIKREV